MKVVGELFGRGEMQLPFVLQSGRDDEGRGRVPRAAHGEGRRRRQGHGRARAPSRATSTTSARTSSTSSSPTTATGPQPRHQGRRSPRSSTRRSRSNADAIGMSGLLVKSTIIMRENLEELNDRGLADTCRCCSAAPRSPATTSSATCARSTRAASSTARTRSRACARWTRSWQGKQHRRRSTPTFGRDAGGRNLPPPQERARRADAAGRDPRRAPTSRPTSPIFTPPFVGSRVAKGISLDEIAGYINETALFRNQWQFRPDKARRERRRVQGAHPPDAARRSSTIAKAGGLARARGRRGATSPVNAEGNDLVVWKDDTRTQEWLRFYVPAPAQGAVPLHRRLLPPGRVRRAPTTRRSTS